MKHLISFLLVFVAAVLFAACGGGAPIVSRAIQPESGPVPPPSVGNETTGGVVTPGGGVADSSKSALSLPSAADRLIVYTGSLSLEVKDTDESVAKINDILKASNGYIASRSLVSDSKNIKRGNISIRVPAAALDSALAQIKAIGIKVLREDSKSNDVTEEYTDLDARRKNLEAAESELTKLLDTVRERTGKAEDILAIYNQLTQIRGQIEQIKGRQKFLESTSALATYTIEFVPHEEALATAQGVTWDPGRTVRSSLAALVQVLQTLADVGIRLVLLVLPTLLIILLPLAVLFWIVRRFWRRRRPVKTTATA